MRDPSGVAGLAALLLGALLAPALLAPGVPAAAPAEGSFGITPPSLEVAEAQRGETYLRQVTLQNGFPTETLVTIEPIGAVGAWTRTEPAGSFVVPPRSQRTLDVAIAVPRDAPNGLHGGFLRLVAEPKEPPQGSGFALRHAVAAVLNVTVGGQAVVRLAWLDAAAGDVEQGSPPVAAAGVRNDGNVHTVARAEAEVRRAVGDEVLLTAQGSLDLAPGQAGEVPLAFDAGLPPGSYRAVVRSVAPGGWEQVVEFRVVPPGSLGKAGELRALRHEPWVPQGAPVKVAALFENTGPVGIGRAKLTAEVTLGGRLVAVLESDERVVPPGASLELVAFFTPASPGRHAIAGTVGYDGFETPVRESVLNVQAGAAAGPGLPGWALLAAAVALAGVGAAAWFLAGRRARRRGPGRGR